ncbi:ABC transporter substrate-binding protein [Brevibacillus humidisoli]|uniref:ABC transporter substrate-binding protein n=1 Tax=Brevibacillus humidisoli TaxID=2895522 RepID=UPI001E49C95E|nr:ABC transporter substrate-binding protein [Brevibacillus humidisoli]UFJ39697.1 ABC transporter substrate-binding protein [Brevibacillus humidisoli]
MRRDKLSRERLRKGLASVLLAVSMLSLAACGSQATEPSGAPADQPPATADSDQVIQLGLTQFVEHPALDSVRKGILDGLAEAGYEEGKNLEVDYQNAHAEVANTVSIAQKFSGDKKDLVVAIATPSAQAVAKAITDVPIVFSTVTDPVSAQLVETLEKPGKNVTGTSDKVSMERQLDLIQQFVPELKQLGVVYTTSEVNAQVQVEELEKAAKEKGIELVKSGISNSSEVQVGTQVILDKVQAILIPVDNTVVSSVEGVLIAAQKANVPVFASDVDTVKRGAVATHGINYYEMGVQTAQMAARILDGAQAAETPVEVSKETDLYINETAAKTFGLTIPDELKQSAAEIVK